MPIALGSLSTDARLAEEGTTSSRWHVLRDATSLLQQPFSGVPSSSFTLLACCIPDILPSTDDKSLITQARHHGFWIPRQPQASSE